MATRNTGEEPVNPTTYPLTELDVELWRLTQPTNDAILLGEW